MEQKQVFTVQEFADRQATVMQNRGHREVKIRYIDPCGIGLNFNSSYYGFNLPKVDPNALCHVDRSILPERGELQGVNVAIDSIKPRCRKVTREYFRAILVEQKEGGWQA